MTQIKQFETQLLSDEIWIESMRYIHKGKDIEQGIREAFGHLIADDDRLRNATLTDCKKLVNTWMTNKRFPRENVVRPKRDISKL
jgi:hypothetical protein